MSDKRRGLGRGLGALIPAGPAPARSDRPVDVFFPGPAPVRDPRRGAALGVPPDDARVAGDLPQAIGRQDADSSSGEAPVEDPQDDVSRETDLVPVPGATFAEIPVEAITPNPRQPRQIFDEDELAELAHSVREIGVLQPVVVRRVDRDPVDGDGHDDAQEGQRYELVMGERRWRASRLAGLTHVPAIVRETGDDVLLRDALLENLHRSQLNALEEAAAYAQLLEDFGCTHDDLARQIGRSRPQISNTIRLLRLPPLVQRRVAAGVLTAGHARALLGLDDAAAIERLAQRIVAEGMSVRAVEEVVSLGGDGDAAPAIRRPRARSAADPQLDEVAARLSDRFDTRVSVVMGRRKGRMTVEFAGVEDLERILAVLDASRDGSEQAGDGQLRRA